MIVQVFLFLASIFGYVIWVLIHAVTNVIALINIVVGLFTGAYGIGVNFWVMFGFSQWALLGMILYPIYVIDLCDKAGSFDPLIHHVKMWSGVFAFMLHLFMQIYELSIGLFTKLVDMIPVVE